MNLIDERGLEMEAGAFRLGADQTTVTGDRSDFVLLDRVKAAYAQGKKQQNEKAQQHPFAPAENEVLEFF